MKHELTIPEFFELMSITSLYKNKGCRSNISNERRIFNVPKVESIFDKAIYSDVYEVIDRNMSFSNVGGRKQRNIRKTTDEFRWKKKSTKKLNLYIEPLAEGL